MAINDATLLARQPASAQRLTHAHRTAIVISAIVDDQGASRVLSRFGDEVWELWPFFEQTNVPPTRKRIDWSRLPQAFREPVKAVMYRYWIAGTPGWSRPSATTLVHSVAELLPFLRYLHRHHIASLSQVQPLHVHHFMHEQQRAGRGPGSMVKYRTVIALLYRLREEHPDRLSFDPWPQESPAARHGRLTAGSVAKTPLIPQGVLRALFDHAEAILRGADRVLDERDAGLRSAVWGRELLRIRDACFFLLGLLTGMRCEEIGGIEVNATRTEVKDNVTYHWVRSIEHKTKKGPVEYLLPSMGLTVLGVMERWSEPLRLRLREQLAAWRREVRGAPERLRRMAAAQSDLNRLFLSAPRGSGITALCGMSWNRILREFAQEAGVDWPLAPHQLRRTYAWTFVRHRLGNTLFLKEQFKHSSLEMTQLYAANPKQDAALYEDILSELQDLKVELIQHWLNSDTPLSGGAGRKITTLRAHTFAHRKELIEDTAETVHIRSTGHGWCLAQDEGCGGAGLYERTRCVGCSNGCIDDSHGAIWQAVYAHQLELTEDAKALGPGAQQRVERDRKVALEVLNDLGLAPSGENK